jgi:hypothetical protein
MEKEEKILINKCRIAFFIAFSLCFLDGTFAGSILGLSADPISILAIFIISFVSAEEKKIWYIFAYILIGSMTFTIFYYFYAIDFWKGLSFSKNRILMLLCCKFYLCILWSFGLVSIIKNYRFRKAKKLAIGSQ